MSRMSVAYQCWEIGSGAAMGYKLSHGQVHAHGHQYVSDGSSFRRHQNAHETCTLSSFSKYMQAQSDPKAHLTHPKDATSAARFATSLPQTPSPLAAGSPRTFTITSEGIMSGTAIPAAVSEQQAATSTITTESDAKTTRRPVEASVTKPPTSEVQNNRKVEVSSGMISGPTGPGSILHGNLLHPSFPSDRALNVVRVQNSKPGVVGHVSFVSSGMPPSCGPVMEAMDDLEYSSESSSSICNGSEDSSCTSEDVSSGDTSEAQSARRGPLSEMADLESSLPIKRPGLSKFFGGKSRSFSSLAEVSTVTDLAKPNNPYAKRRKMGFNCPLGRNSSHPPVSRSSVGGISKKLPSSGSRSTLAVAVKLGELKEEQVEYVGPPLASLRNGTDNRSFPLRSYSLTDLPIAGNTSTTMRRTFGHP